MTLELSKLSSSEGKFDVFSGLFFFAEDGQQMCKSLLISVQSNDFLINSFCVFIHTLPTLFTVAPNITSVLFHFGFFIFFRRPSFLLNLLSHTTSKSEIWLSETVDNHFVVFNLTTELETHDYDLCFVGVKGRHICSAS